MKGRFKIVYAPDDEEKEHIKYAEWKLKGYKYLIKQRNDIMNNLNELYCRMYGVSAVKWEEDASLAAVQKGTKVYRNKVIDYMEEKENIKNELLYVEQEIASINRFLRKISPYDLGIITDYYDIGLTLQEIADRHYESKITIYRRIRKILKSF